MGKEGRVESGSQVVSRSARQKGIRSKTTLTQKPKTGSGSLSVMIGQETRTGRRTDGLKGWPRDTAATTTDTTTTTTAATNTATAG